MAAKQQQLLRSFYESFEAKRPNTSSNMFWKLALLLSQHLAPGHARTVRVSLRPFFHIFHSMLAPAHAAAVFGTNRQTTSGFNKITFLGKHMIFMHEKLPMCSGLSCSLLASHRKAPCGWLAGLSFPC